jgi:hypothetical protein
MVVDIMDPGWCFPMGLRWHHDYLLIFPFLGHRLNDVLFGAEDWDAMETEAAAACGVHADQQGGQRRVLQHEVGDRS